MKMRSIASMIIVFGSLWTAGAQGERADAVTLSVYNNGAALIREQRQLSLDAGDNIVRLGDIAATIDPSSVIVRAGENSGLRILEQSAHLDLADRDALFKRFHGEIITVTAADGTVYSGELIIGRGDDLVLREDDGGIVMPNINQARDIRFPGFPDALTAQPTLQWHLNSESAGDHAIELTYLASGLNWNADYNVLLNSDETAFDLRGWVTLRNRSGAPFSDARLKLVAGDVRREEPQMAMAEARALAFDMGQGGGGGGVDQREVFEYQVYEVERRVSIADQETKQIEFVSASDIAADSIHVFDNSPQFGGYFSPIDYPEGYGAEPGAVLTYLAFNTGADSGLGADLPAGRVRVYQADVDGAGLLIGENRINHSPEGQDLRLLLGSAFDVTGQRRQTDYDLITRRLARESFEITLRSFKETETVEIRVPERLYRWSDWEIIESSRDYEQLDSSSIEFRVELEPGAEETLTYTVEYRFPATW